MTLDVPDNEDTQRTRAYCRQRRQETGKPYMLVWWPGTDGPVLGWWDCPASRRVARELGATCVRVRKEEQL